MRRTAYYKEIQLPQLRTFCLVATRANFTTAARTLGLSKSTVWQQVRALERELGTTLLRRQGTGIELTAEGRLLLELVQPHVSGLDSLARLFEMRRADLPQQVLVAGSPYLAGHFLPRPVREFTLAHPTVRLNLRCDGLGEEEIAVLVGRGKVDLALISYERDRPRSPYLLYEDMFEIPLMLMTSTNHPLARKKRVRVADLAAYPLIVGRGANQSRLERLLNRHNQAGRSNVVLESSLTDIIQKYVAQDVGIGLFHVSPRSAEAMPGVRLRVFDPHMEKLPVALVVRKDIRLAEPVEEFRQFVRRCLHQPSPSKQEKS